MHVETFQRHEVKPKDAGLRLFFVGRIMKTTQDKTQTKTDFIKIAKTSTVFLL